MKKILFGNTFLLLFLATSVFFSAQTPAWKWAVTTADQANDFAKDVATDAAGNVYLTGMFASPTINFNGITLTKNQGATFDIYVAKYNANGAVLWAKNFSAAGREESWGIATDPSGNVYITGIFTSASVTFGAFTLTNSAVNYDGVFVVKLDTDGNVLWAKKGIGSALDKESNDIAVDTSGNVAIAGYTSFGTLNFEGASLNNASNGNLFVIKFDTNGNVLWSASQSATSQNRADGIATDGAGNIYITGFYTKPVFGLPSKTDVTAFLAKYSSSGNFLWAAAPDTARSYSFDVHATSTGKVLITGSFDESTITFGEITLTNATINGTSDTFITQYDSEGNLEWAKSGAGANIDRAYKIASDAMGSIYLTGFFESPTIKFGGITITKPNNSTQNCFLTKYNSTGNEMWALAIDKTNMGSSSPNGGLATDAFGNVLFAGHAFNNVKFGAQTFDKGGIFLSKLSDGVLAVDDAQAEKLIIFPNPVKDAIHFSGKHSVSRITIFSADGRMLREKLMNGEKELNVSDLKKGIYILNMLTENGIQQTKIIKN